MLFVRFVFKKINILNSSLKFALSLQELKGDICHSHSSALAEHSHATYHYLSNLGDKQYLPSKQPSSPGASPRLRYMLSYFHHLYQDRSISLPQHSCSLDAEASLRYSGNCLAHQTLPHHNVLDHLLDNQIQ